MTYDESAWTALETQAITDRDADSANWPTDDNGDPVEPHHYRYIATSDSGPYRYTIPITFLADAGETLPDDQSIAEVSIIEGEYAHTECITDDSFTAYGAYASGTN